MSFGRMGRLYVVSGLYLACMAGFVYGFADHQVGYGSDVASVLVLVVLVALHVATGVGARRWWVVVLPVVAVLLAIPAGYPDARRGEPLPIWFGLALVAPAGALLIGVGSAATLAWSRWHGPSRARR